jgi:hypothetical protein
MLWHRGRNALKLRPEGAVWYDIVFVSLSLDVS